MASKAKSKPQSPEPSKSTESKTLSDPALQFLLKEYDALRDLFTQTESSTQTIFNFYLTLMTTVVGAIVLIVQVTAPDPSSVERSQFTISGLLIFAVSIGSAYLSSLTGRYAHLARYAQGIDELRKHLIDLLDVPLPPIYKSFLAQEADRLRQPPKRKLFVWFYWLFPTGTYQLFVAVINSFSLAMATWLFLSATHITQEELIRSVVVSVVIFFFAFEVCNIYSHVVMQILIRRLNVRVDSQRDLPFIIGKQ